MNTETKKCPMCAEQIPLTGVTCAYCGAQFQVTSTGYCQNCHLIREADENGRCNLCGNEVLDHRVESRFIEETGMETALPFQPMVQKKNRNILPLSILAVVMVLSGVGGFLFLRRDALPAAPILIDTPTLAATATVLPTSTTTMTPTQAPTRTPRATPMATADQRLLNPANQHLYLHVKLAMSWHAARDYCASRGGHLVTIQAPSENKFVYDLAARYNSEAGTWLGGTDEEIEGTWVWVTGEPWTYSNWRKEHVQIEPDNKSHPTFNLDGPNGADFLIFDGWDKTWHDWDEVEKYFVCEWEPVAP